MSVGLLTKAHVARWMGKRPQDIASLIKHDGLPAVPVPSNSRQDDRITLHGLWRWCKERSKGGVFMSVDELAYELERCQAGVADTSDEQALLSEMATLSEVVKRNLKQGTDPRRTRLALQTVIRDWQNTTIQEWPNPDAA